MNKNFYKIVLAGILFFTTSCASDFKIGNRVYVGMKRFSGGNTEKYVVDSRFNLEEVATENKLSVFGVYDNVGKLRGEYIEGNIEKSPVEIVTTGLESLFDDSSTDGVKNLSAGFEAMRFYYSK